MLTTSILQVGESMFTIYEINEPGFTRTDFVQGSANFHTEPDAVIYSVVHKRKTYTYGNRDFYEQFLLLKEEISCAKMQSTKKSEWIDGVFTVITESSNIKTGYSMRTVHQNGVLYETVLQKPGYSLITVLTDPVYGVKLDPLNFEEYIILDTSGSTVTDEAAGALYHSIDYLKRKYDIAHIDNLDVCVATDIETARTRLKQIKNSPSPFIGFDTETTGLDVTIYGEDEMVGVIVAADANTSTYFPFRHQGNFNLPMDFLTELMDVVLSLQDKLVGHNVKFDREVMLKEGYDVQFKWDTMQLSIILNPVISKGTHALKTLMQALDGKQYLELENIFINSRDIDFSVLPVEIIKYYACTDASSVIELLADQLKKLPKYQYQLALLECSLSNVKADMEFYGIRVDVKRYERQYKNCNYIIEKLLEAFRILTREDGNINSPQVLLPLLYDKMKCKVLLRTKKGQPSTSAAAIKKLARTKASKPHNITEDIVDLYGDTVIKASELANAKYPALVILAKYREYNKLKTAFYARFERTMKTGRVFFWVNQNGAATGRQSSPMHQLPPDLKEVILSDAEDRDFWGPDFSQIELRMIAYLAGETELIELAKDPDNDIHRIIGSLITGKEMWAITPEERSTGKRRNFGVVYLISAMGLAGQLFGPGYTQENVEFCQQQLDDFYKHFKRIDRYIKENGRKVQKYGYMQTAWYNRRRMFPEIFDPNLEPGRKASILRMANNVPVQGTAADYMKLAEVQMYQYIREKGWNEKIGDFPKVRMMLSIHDELIISAHQSIPCEEIVEMITLCMQTPVDGAPPFFVQPARMTSWADHSDDSLSMPIKFRDDIIKKYNETHVSQFKQSYFRLEVPSDVVMEMNKDTNESTHSLASRIYKKCKLVFDHGDYVTTYEDSHLKEAVLNYVESNKVIYRIDNYRELLNAFRDGQLSDYMADLIQKYGTDANIVGNKVRHPSLTHSLLDVYSKELKGKDLTHEERIVEATRLYIDELLSNKERAAVMFQFQLSEKQISDRDLFTEQLQASVTFDPNGEVIYETADEEEEVDDNFWNDPDPESLLSAIYTTPTYVWEMGDAITFDLNRLNSDSVNQVLSYVYERKRDDGFYTVYIIYGDKLLNTNMRLEELNFEEANNTVLKLLEGNHVLSVV